MSTHRPLRPRPLVIAHRGASGYRPEHTLAAYQLALDQGADFIEPDLVATLDGVLICRHENALAVLHADGSLNLTETSTDVYRRADFAARLVTKRIDGRAVRGWFSEDFTLSEIKTLRAIERLPALRPTNTQYNGHFEIPSFAEVIELIKAHAVRTGHRAGVYPETKHPSYFLEDGFFQTGARIGIHLGRALVATLVDHRFTDPTRVFIQSFEIGNLQELRRQILPAAGLAFPLIQLIDAHDAPYDTLLAGQPQPHAALLTPPGLQEIARYAAGIGPFKQLLIPRSADGALSSPTPVIEHAHAAGLEVHAWTFRAENYFLPAPQRRGTQVAARGALEDEIRAHFAAGLDGVFSDHPDYALRARDA